MKYCSDPQTRQDSMLDNPQVNRPQSDESSNCWKEGTYLPTYTTTTDCQDIFRVLPMSYSEDDRRLNNIEYIRGPGANEDTAFFEELYDLRPSSSNSPSANTSSNHNDTTTALDDSSYNTENDLYQELKPTPIAHPQQCMTCGDIQETDSHTRPTPQTAPDPRNLRGAAQNSLVSHRLRTAPHSPLSLHNFPTGALTQDEDITLSHMRPKDGNITNNATERKLTTTQVFAGIMAGTRISRHSSFYTPVSVHGSIKGRRTIPQSVEKIIESNACDQQLYSPRWRRGMDAFNDVEEFGKAFRKAQEAKVKAEAAASAILMRSPRFSRPKHVSVSTNTTCKSRDASTRSQLPNILVNAKGPCEESMSSTVHTNTDKESSVVDETPPVIEKRRHRGPDRFAVVVQEAMDKHHRPAPECRSMQRRDALHSDLGKISFVLTFHVPYDSHHNWPCYVVEGYRRASQSIRFNVPCDLSTLERMTPLEYLRRHTRVDVDMKYRYNKRFDMFQKRLQKLSDKSTLNDVQNSLFMPLDNLFNNKLGRENYDQVHSVILFDEDLVKLSQKDFIGICAFTERCFWRMFDGINEEVDDKNIGCRPHIEYLDFRLVERNQDELSLSLRIKVLLASLA